MAFIDTHAHLDGEEFADDLHSVVQRAMDAGCRCVFVPGINVQTSEHLLKVCDSFKGFLYPMLGLHPEEVEADYRQQLLAMKKFVYESASNDSPVKIIAVGEIGLDFYWSRDFYEEQLQCFEEQVRWAVELHLPLMIHCRKAQAEMVRILRKYEKNLVGGVFHCFTGNEQEARELLSFQNFLLGIGGVSTFKSSHLTNVLHAVVPLSRIVLETDSPYMAPVPMRGQRNEPSFIPYIIKRLADGYNIPEEDICRQTIENTTSLFAI